MKVAVLGGASFSTPALFRDMDGEFAGCEFTLLGRSAERLHATARAARELSGANAPTVTSAAPTRHNEPQVDFEQTDGKRGILDV